MWDEYISFWSLPSCSCSFLETCTCTILKNLSDQQQADYVMKFLIGLYDSYSTICSQLLLSSPLSFMGKVFSLLLQEEGQRSLTNFVGLSLNSHAMTAIQRSNQATSKHFKSSKPRGKSDVICSHHGYNDHTTYRCFQLIGYSQGRKGPKGKISLLSQSHGAINQCPTNASNTVSLEQNLNFPNIIFFQEQIQNLLTLANNL